MEHRGEQQINERAQLLLKALVEHYIENGQPIGSRTLVEEAELLLSSATVRNVLASLEERGFLRSPHTSSGRIPTQAGYRYFVDQLIEFKPLEPAEIDSLCGRLNPDLSAHELVESASGLLSEITRMAGVVTLPRREQAVLRQVSFLNLSEKRVLVIMVLDDHEVVNQVIRTTKNYSEAQLQEAANFISYSYSGISVPEIKKRLLVSMKSDRKRMDSLMQTILDLVDKAFEEQNTSDCVVAGQENLIDTSGAEALLHLKELFKAFSLKRDILDLLEKCLQTGGLQLLIGEESGYQMLDDFTVITAPYRVEGRPAGVLGVIGPTRMAYKRVIPLVDATATMLSTVMATANR